MNNTVSPIQREHGRRWALAKRQLTVRIVLEDHEVVGGGQLNQPDPLFVGECAARRIVEVGDYVSELDRTLGQGPFYRFDIDTVRLQRYRHELDSALLEQQQGAIVGRLFDNHPIAR